MAQYWRTAAVWLSFSPLCGTWFWHWPCYCRPWWTLKQGWLTNTGLLAWQQDSVVIVWSPDVSTFTVNNLSGKKFTTSLHCPKCATGFRSKVMLEIHLGKRQRRAMGDSQDSFWFSSASYVINAVAAPAACSDCSCCLQLTSLPTHGHHGPGLIYKQVAALHFYRNSEKLPE